MNDLNGQLTNKICDLIYKNCTSISLLNAFINDIYKYMVIDLGFKLSACPLEIQETIDYIINLTEAEEIKSTAGMFKDYSITLKKYNLNKILKEIVFE